MSTKIYVGNLACGTTEADIAEMFAPHGFVRDIQLIVDKFSKDFRRFVFLTMNDEEGAKRAVRALDGTVLGGQYLKVVGTVRRRHRDAATESRLMAGSRARR